MSTEVRVVRARPSVRAGEMSRNRAAVAEECHALSVSLIEWWYWY